MLKSLGTLLLLVCLLAMPWQGARSQDADDEQIEIIIDDFEDGELAEAFQLFSIIGITPGLSGAKFSIDGDDGDSDLEISSVKLPIRREWDRGSFCLVASDDQREADYELQPLAKVRSDDALCATPYTELTLSYLQADQRLEIDDATDFRFDVTALSALAGFGLTFQITERTSFRPILLGGYSHIDNDSDFDGEGEDQGNEDGDGVLVNSKLDTFLVGGAAELRHERVLENDVELQGSLRYNHLVSSTIEATDRALEGTSDFIVVTGKLEASVPTGFQLFSREVRVLGFGGTNLLLDSFGEKFSEDDFIHEVGGGLELKNPMFVQGIRLRGSVLFGEDVTGWRAGLAIQF